MYANHCAQLNCRRQHSRQQFWLSSILCPRQSSLLRCYVWAEMLWSSSSSTNITWPITIYWLVQGWEGHTVSRSTVSNYTTPEPGLQYISNDIRVPIYSHRGVRHIIFTWAKAIYASKYDLMSYTSTLCTSIQVTQQSGCPQIQQTIFPVDFQELQTPEQRTLYTGWPLNGYCAQSLTIQFEACWPQS